MKRIGVSDNRSGPILHQVDSAATCLPMNLNIDDQILFHSIVNFSMPILHSFHAITFNCCHYHTHGISSCFSPSSWLTSFFLKSASPDVGCLLLGTIATLAELSRRREELPRIELFDRVELPWAELRFGELAITELISFTVSL